MLKKIFSLSEKGRKNLHLGIFFTCLHHLSVMVPVVLFLMVISDFLKGSVNKEVPDFLFYFAGSSVLFFLIFLIYRFTYRKIYIAAYKESANTRIVLAEKIRKLPLSYFGKKDLSDLTSTLMDDTTTVEHTLASVIPEIFAGIISSSIVIVLLLYFNFYMGLSLFICLPVSIAILMLSYKFGSSSNWNNRNAKLKVSESVQEYLENIKALHSSPNRDSYRSGVENNIKRVVRTSIIYELVMGFFISGAYNTLRIGLGVVIVTGTAFLLENKIDPLTYLLFLFVAARVYDPLTVIFLKTGELFYSLVGAQRIRQLNNYPAQTGDPDITLESFDIEFKDVSFAYDEQMVIKNVSFTANQGDITALIGPSGCGKSTLSKLASRFWDVDKGAVLIGGKNIKHMDPEILLGYFSIVFQDVLLFNDTVYNNIKIGRKDATEEQVFAAAKLARCEEFIENLAEKYNTMIGENGKTLSGGERQRISIARAFLKDAPIILLDEATASLDPENETLIQQALGKLIKDKTVIVIAHRLRSVEFCDKIVVLKQGRVHETGTHKELIGLNGLYTHLFNLQMESSRWHIDSVN